MPPSASPSQTNRLIAIESDLGPDVLLLRSFTCREAVSSLYTIVADVMVDALNVSKVTAQNLVGKPVVIKLHISEETTGRERRYFHGIVRTLRITGKEERFTYFQLEIVPPLWRMTEATDCRIFQNKTVPEIVEQILGEFSFSDFDMPFNAQYKSWDYCVMYRESYWDFLNRLLEEEGIFYFWRHTQQKVELVLGDSPDAIVACPERSKARYEAEGGGGESGDPDVVYSFEYSETLTPGAYASRDHNFQLPTNMLETSEPSLVSIGDNSELEIYEFPGGIAQKFVKPDERLGEIPTEANTIAKRRMELEEVDHKVCSGQSRAFTLVPGFWFELTKHFRAALNMQYSLLSVRHRCVQTPSFDNDERIPEPYHNAFTCIPHSVQFRPARRTRIPCIAGPQTAIVVGPSGEEIYPDKFGRVKVQFHWDRYGANDENSSGWVRVATPWAGNHWGMIHLPRIGQEVVVHFIDGDPDRPLIIGSVYNPDQMPPYQLPDEMTKSGIKSRSTKNGSDKNFNEIRFEDKKGKEEIHVHAERNLRTLVEAAEIRTVGATRTTTVWKDDKYTNKEGNVLFTVEKESRTTEIQKDDSTTLNEGSYSLNVKQKDVLITVDMGNMETKVSLGGHTTSVPLGTTKLESMSVESTASTTMTLKANASIKLQCGASSIELTPGVIMINAPLVKIN